MWYSKVVIHPSACYMMNEPCHIHPMQCGFQFMYLALDGSTTQSWAVSLPHTCSHTNPSTSTFPSDNKDACRCFHNAQLKYTASVLHVKETDIEMARWCRSFVGDCMFFFCVSVPVRGSVWMSEKALAEGEREREPAVASQGLFTSAGGLSEMLFPLLYLDFFQLAQCTSHSGR